MTSRALVVLAHPRGDSLTAQVAARARARLEAAGVAVDLLDLHAEGFDPRMILADEPDWGNRDKTYSAEVTAHMRRIDAADLIVAVFPVWWYGLPAILKGWVDRVWNYGFAYGRSTARLRGKRMVWLGLAGEPAEAYAEHGLGEMLERQLTVGISQFCGIEEVTVRLLYGALPDEPTTESVARILDKAEMTVDGVLRPAAVLSTTRANADPGTPPEP